MSQVFDYTFNNQTRIGDDSCDLSQSSIQNVNAANYLLTNFKPECPMTNAVEFATSHPFVNFSGSHQIGIGGCNIDESSQLQISELTRSKCKISLTQRPFVTVPYIGRGKSNAVLETQLQQGELANNKKSINPSAELSYLKYSQTPLIPEIKMTINNPANLIEGVAAEGWIRGGIPTRDLIRDQDNKNHN